MNKKLPSEWDRAHGKKTRIHLHMPDTLLAFMDKWIKQGRFLDRSTLIRQACWQLIERLEGLPEVVEEALDELQEELEPPTKAGPTISDLFEMYKFLQEDVPG